MIYPTWTGNFYFDLGRNFQLNAVTKLQYQKTKSKSLYQGAGETAINTNASDEAAMGQIMLQVNKAINERNVIDLQGYYIFNNDKVTLVSLKKC